MDRVTAAEVFIETVGRGNISAAAAHLRMSRAMASRYIAVLEEWAGVRLLHRTTRQVSLTAAGEQILPICREMLALSRDVSEAGEAVGRPPKGILRVTTTSIFAQFCLTDLIAAFVRQYPGVSVDLQITDRQVNLAEDAVDLAIRVSKELDPNLISRKLAECPSLLCASPRYLQERGEPTHIRDLSSHNCLTYAYVGQGVWRFKTDRDEVAVPVRGNFSTNEALVLMRAAIAGAGITILPAFALTRALSDGSLVRVLPDVEAERFGIFAVYLSRHRMPSSLRALIDFLAANMALPR